MAQFNKTTIGKSEQWLIEAAASIGLDFSVLCHEITSDFKRHVIKRHGNEESEKAFGQIPVQESDFEKIPDIVNTPDYVIIGAKSKGRDILAYAKALDDITFLYFAEVLNSKRNKTLRGKTMYKRNGPINASQFLKIISTARGVDITMSKIFSPGVTGSYPDFVMTADSCSKA